MSPRYQETPKGALGTCRTKKSKSVLPGRPCTVTSMTSTEPAGVIFTLAFPLGTQPLAPADTSMVNVMESSSGDVAAAAKGAADRIAQSAAEPSVIRFVNMILFSFDLQYF